ncbi:hypothetical protein E3N88_27510 [Mikania micrantha]|uniref:Uncharacterized protein n=1 Tax=Mikania micrantha TaxID=192012 RepID=A0A5N6MWV7_9ASTR|nr:hypothetical protein E3N88_27510 [Mikania micrantha]
MDKQYSSQPVDKPSKWILSKWRRPNFLNETSSDKCNEMQGEGSRSNETKQPQQIKKRKWAIPDDESEKWSKDAIEFFNKGDSPFCYSAVFFKSEKLDKRFWGTLLGYCSNGYLTPNNMKSHTRPAMDHEARIRPQVSFHIANEDNLVQEGHSLHLDRKYLRTFVFVGIICWQKRIKRPVPEAFFFIYTVLFLLVVVWVF